MNTPKTKLIKAFADINNLELKDIPLTKNQCDGCVAGHCTEVMRFSGELGHVDPKTRRVYMICQAGKYPDED